MSDIRDCCSGPVVLLCENRVVETPVFPSDINWSHAFQVVLEKRGFVDFQVWSYADFAGASPNQNPVGAFFVGPCLDGGISKFDLDHLKGFDCPVFLEAHSLSRKACEAAGLSVVEQASDLSCSVRIRPDRARLLAILNAFGSLVPRSADGIFDLPNGKTSTRYEPPGPSAFRINDNDCVDLRATRVALNLLFAYCRRIESGEPLFAASRISAMAALAMSSMIPALASGADANYVRSYLDRLLRSLRGLGEVTDLVRLCECVLDHGLSALPAAEMLCEMFPQLRASRDSFRSAEPLADDPTIPATSIAAAAVLAYVDGMVAEHRSIVAYLMNHRLDRDRSSLFTMDAQSENTCKFSNHPIVLFALALSDLRTTDVLPSYLDCADMGISEERARKWAEPPLGYRASCVHLDGTIMSFVEERENAAVWSDGNFVILGFPALAIMGYAHTLSPLDAPFLGNDGHRSLLLEELFFALVEEGLSASRRIVARVLPWAEDGAPLVIRHDVDRIPTRDQFEWLLKYYARTNVRCSWYWLPDRLDRSFMRELNDRGHEIGLHAMFGAKRRDEIRTIELVIGRPVTGECFHGSGTEYHRGALSVMASVASGLAYSELNPGMYGYPYTSFPMLGDDGSLGYETRLVHMTFSVTTDGIKGKSRKTDVTMDLDLAKKWAGLGYYTCLLNHPDMNFEPMAGFVEQMRQDGLVCKTMTEVADWWRRTHRQGAVRVRAEVTSRETVRLSVTGEVLPGGLAVCLYGWTAVRMEAPASNSEVSLTHDGEKRWVMLKFGESAKADLTFALSPG